MKKEHRHPDAVKIVKSFEVDSARRDLTINSLGLTADGKIIDYQGGIEDIKNKIVKAVGTPSERFKEDALRIYRLLRFAVKMGFDIDPETKRAAIELKDLTGSLSKERIAEEFYKVASISGKALADYIRKLDEVGLLEKELPEVYALKQFEHDPRRHPEGGPYEHSLAGLEVSRSKDPVTNLAILFHDLGKGTTYEWKDDNHTYHGHEAAGRKLIGGISRRLRLRNTDREAMQFAANKHMVMHKPEILSKSKLAAIVTSPYWPVMKEVLFADQMSRSHAMGGQAQFDKDVEKWRRGIEYSESILKDLAISADKRALDKKLHGIINGNMVLALIPELGVVSNRPIIGKIINQIKEYILDNDMFDISEDEMHDLIITISKDYLNENV